MIENRISDRAKILLIDEDTSISYLIRRAMEKENYKIYIAGSGKQGMEMSTGVCPDLILMDNKFSDMEGITLIQWFREWTDCPIIILSERSSYLDKVEALYAGADDYMVKPFGVLELSARIRSLLRRVRREEKKDILSYQGISINKKTREASSSGRVCELTLKEFELLCYLLENQARVVTRDELLNQIWGYEYDGETRTLDMHIRTLRQKLGEEGGSCIKTVRGVGYRLVRSETKEEDR